MEGTRLDVALVERGLASSRERAKALISSGLVLVSGRQAEKSSQPVNQDTPIALRGSDIPYVSRGGLKLKQAMDAFPISLDGRVCCDIGASTGGFTDCMLQNGAKRVYAIDVGYGQLAWKLRQDPRVVNLERTNIRKVTAQEVPELVSFCSIDVSFISLSLVLPVAYHLLEEQGSLVALIKPQFEAGRSQVGKKGVVRDPAVHLQVVEKVLLQAKEVGFFPSGITYSPVRGPEGNIEYLAFLKKQGITAEVTLAQMKRVVEESHQML